MTGSALALHEILASSEVLRSTLLGIERAAASDAPLLITGEAGTGRTALARAVHAAGRRWQKPLVEVDPASLPATLFESELFGHLSGAFTGAEQDQQGRVGRAEGGALLLDNVEELPLSVQPKLLRLLAERRYAPLGGSETDADVRFLAVGTHELPERVEKGAFRQDLFYRLEVVVFRLPALRERREDLPVLAEHFLSDLAERFGRSRPTLSRDSLEWMKDFSWPGNLRQLRNVLERELILGHGGVLEIPPLADLEEGRPRPLARVEAEEIRKALAYTRGRKGRAAELLGVSRKALWEKRRRHGIP